MKSNFQRNLIIGFGFSLFLLITGSAASIISIRNLISSAEWVEHTNQVIRHLDDVLSHLKDAETSQRGFLITGDREFLEPYRGAEDSIMRHIRFTKEMTADNVRQQASAEELTLAIRQRLAVLNNNIDKKKRGAEITVDDMERGKEHMDRARMLVTEMKTSEQYLLAQRTSRMNAFAGTTPVFVLIASIVAIFITIVSFLKVNGDYKQRIALQKELEKKDEDITRRIHMTQEVAARISAGDYAARITDEVDDGLGQLTVSLNRMAASLEKSFTDLADREWLQSGVAALNDQMIGEYELDELARRVLDFVVPYTNGSTGAVYVAEEGGRLRLYGRHAAESDGLEEVLNFGEGLAGQSALSRKPIVLEDVPEGLLRMQVSCGAIQPKSVIALPLYHERKVMGVLEVASLRSFSNQEKSFLESAVLNIGTVIHILDNRKRLQELLEETQSQAEELQAQHNELENANSELEAQTEKLQASEEELRTQQEELVDANSQLEERARLLEETNRLVKDSNREIQRKAEELAQSTKYKSEFLANMSHELRTPLNSILLLSRLMVENNERNLSAEQIEYARVIQNSGKGLLMLIDEILDLSKIEAGKMDLVYTEAGVEEVVKDMRALFEPLAREKGVDFGTEIAEDVQGVFETDRQRLDQILRNLLSNAIKFTDEGRVTLRAWRPADYTNTIAFTVADTGIGIAADKQDVVFEAFQQEDGSTRRRFGGTGLGLSISRELARLMGGEIRLVSEPGQGSQFTVLLPVSSGVGKVEKLSASELMPAKEKSVYRQRFVSDAIPVGTVEDDRAAMKPGDKCILIVEDDLNFARSLLEFTRGKGYKGIVTVRGDEAQSLAEQFLPAGILLDIQLPVKDGWEVMEELKSHPATRHIPVHIMSAFQARFKSLSKGAVDFIDKPLTFDKMDDIFRKIEFMLHENPRKVLIVEENLQHAKALAYFLENYKVNTEIRNDISGSLESLQKQEVNCVILDMGVSHARSYETLEQVKREPGLENIPIIVFTGKNLSRDEESKIRGYADSVVVKVANSYQRIMDEVSLFLHLVEGEKKDAERPGNGLGRLAEVLRGKNILLADDDVRNIFSLTRALESFGMKVISATDGSEALQLLSNNRDVDIVLMDMMMPEMDGYESTRRIKADPATRHLPVIAVTAKAMKGDREKCIAAGASDYISKPVDIDQLLSLLRVWLYDSGK
ncbi:response regulator [Chitinophaga rhizosphaerae]|uniref:response regulator n=1 Tax=Chitinophaga rhizosphaerae TaxID=1864947 RepID=UPI000F8149AA|nr:response regulator [Chitinophaga rhizosphaerae]